MIHGVAAIGLCSWDRFIVTDQYPGPGEYAIVRQRFEQAGGTTGNACAALALLGVDVTLVSRVGDDEEGRRLVASLRDTGCGVDHVETISGSASDSGVIVISGELANRDRTIYWIQGVKPVSGMTFPIDEMLAREWLMIDIDDARLRSFLLDLPAHRSPRTRLFGTMTYVVEMDPAAGWDQIMRHDAVAGNARELMTLTGCSDLSAATDIASRDIRHNACRVVFVSNGPHGGLAITESGVVSAPAIDVDVVDTTGAGDAFAAGCLWGMLEHCDEPTILSRANALGGLACRALGARAGLPTRVEVERVIREQAGTQ
ncbi:MAG TPA: carbohydrate kinase family protein [Thermomicrobiales bacterium]|nr:carbohydrate kinase family protein [Thermomicrobiales bacterium]